MENNDSIESYITLSKSYEELEKLLHSNEEKNWENILELLNIFVRRLNEFPLLVQVGPCKYSIILQLSQQINNLKEFIQKRHFTPKIPTTEKTKRPLEQSEGLNKKQKTNKDEISNIVKNALTEPKIKGFNEIAGLSIIKKTLHSIVILPKIQPQLFENRTICNSILLFGPPGTGKTRIVHGLAAESGFQLFSINVSDILSPYVGQTEKTIKALFEYFKNNDVSSILFIDEIDGFCRKRSSGEHEYSRRLKTELMCQMSSLENNKTTFVICATNCPWDLDTAILRRFQKRIYVPLPERYERLIFFDIYAKDIHRQNDTFGEVLDKTNGYSYSDLANVVQNALNMPLLELEDNIFWKKTNDGFYEPTEITEKRIDLTTELGNLPPNTARARQAVIKDLLVSANLITNTVSGEEIKKYDTFINK